MTLSATSTSSSLVQEPVEPIRVLSLSRAPMIIQVLAPGAYAWSVTVLPGALGHSSGWLPAVSAAGALGSLVAGALLHAVRPTLAYAFGIWGFIGLSATTWWLAPSGIELSRIDAAWGLAGTLGWMLFALGWGTPWRRATTIEHDPRAELFPKLQPRNQPGWMPSLTAGGAAACSLASLALAWRASDTVRELLGVCIATAAGVLVCASAVAIVRHLGTARAQLLPRDRLVHALPWFLALAVTAVVAVVSAVLRTW